MSTENLIPLAEVRPYDVICGRNKLACQNIGNRRFRVAVSIAVPRYKVALRPRAKNVVTKSVIRIVHTSEGRFLRKCKDRGREDQLVVLSSKETHEKVAHALRDAVKSARKAAIAERAENCVDCTVNFHRVRHVTPLSPAYTDDTSVVTAPPADTPYHAMSPTTASASFLCSPTSTMMIDDTTCHENALTEAPDATDVTNNSKCDWLDQESPTEAYPIDRFAAVHDYGFFDQEDWGY